MYGIAVKKEYYINVNRRKQLVYRTHSDSKQRLKESEKKLQSSTREAGSIKHYNIIIGA